MHAAARAAARCAVRAAAGASRAARALSSAAVRPSAPHSPPRAASARWRPLAAAPLAAAVAAVAFAALSEPRFGERFAARAFSAAAASAPLPPRWRVLPVTGDGRCLFRSVVQATAAAAGAPLLDAAAELAAADALRSAAVDELVRRREQYEWAIEGDFDAYTRAMRAPYAWGGEMELLMASLVLRAPIAVVMAPPGEAPRVIGTYGEEFGGTPARVLFHGAGHYEALLPEREEGAAVQAAPRARL
jgi:hypothetical protein